MKTCSVQTCRTSFGSASAGSRGVPHRRFSLHEGPASCIPASGWGIFSSPIHHCLPQSYVPKDLRSAGYVFVRHDAHRSPLQPPCVGTFRVFKVGPKTFRVDMRGCCKEVSMDCLKPAHVFPDEPGPNPPQIKLSWHPGPDYCFGGRLWTQFPGWADQRNVQRALPR